MTAYWMMQLRSGAWRDFVDEGEGAIYGRRPTERQLSKLPDGHYRLLKRTARGHQSGRRVIVAAFSVVGRHVMWARTRT